MNKMTSLYILWGVVMCLQLAFIFRDTTHIVGYTLEFINPRSHQGGLRASSQTLLAYRFVPNRAVGDASVWCRMRHAQYAVHCVALSVEQHFL